MVALGSQSPPLAGRDAEVGADISGQVARYLDTKTSPAISAAA
jgi:hypothetical protein